MKKYDYYVNLGLVGISVTSMRYDASINNIWLYSGDNILCGISLSIYNFKFSFKSEDTNTLFFNISRK